MSGFNPAISALLKGLDALEGFKLPGNSKFWTKAAPLEKSLPLVEIFSGWSKIQKAW